MHIAYSTILFVPWKITFVGRMYHRSYRFRISAGLTQRRHAMEETSSDYLHSFVGTYIQGTLKGYWLRMVLGCVQLCTLCTYLISTSRPRTPKITLAQHYVQPWTKTLSCWRRLNTLNIVLTTTILLPKKYIDGFNGHYIPLATPTYVGVRRTTQSRDCSHQLLLYEKARVVFSLM